MNELSRAEDAALSRYEKLLLLKNDLKKECFQLEQEYTREFGKEVLEIFRLQIECARKVKTIEFCQMYLNRGQDPDGEALQKYVQQETQELIDHLHAMQKTYKNAKDATEVSAEDLKTIKTMYRGIAKQIHPDIHPELAEVEELQDLWNQVNIAYQCNDLEQLKELDLLISVTLAGLSEQKATLDIPDVEEKIKKLEWEIREIRSKDPYQYKNLFSKPELVKEKHLELQQQAEEYRQYSAQLDEKLSMILPEGSFLFWSDEWWGEA